MDAARTQFPSLFLLRYLLRQEKNKQTELSLALLPEHENGMRSSNHRPARFMFRSITVAVWWSESGLRRPLLFEVFTIEVMLQVQSISKASQIPILSRMPAFAMP
ncbi:MAG: hypothetical protein IPP94_13995 [Ignavibacteria bacterium]|nr:hypothetical protein [Ignavibacteria bacterium]